MNTGIPSVPELVVAIVNVFAPYLIALVTQIDWSPTVKRVVAIAASLIVTGLALAIYYAITGEQPGNWAELLLLGVMVSQSVFALLAKPAGIIAVERATSRGRHAGEIEAE